MSTSPAHPPTVLWRGDLFIQGLRRQLRIPVMARSFSLPDTPSLNSSAAWPRHLDCHRARLRSHSAVCDRLYAEHTRWYAQFVPVDEHGAEVQHSKFDAVVRVLAERNLVFEVACESASCVLYLLSMRMEGGEACLLGVCWERGEEVDVLEARDMAWSLGEESHDGLVAEEMREIQVWEGVLLVQGHRSNMNVTCVAKQDEDAAFVDASGWPARLVCDAANLSKDQALVEEMNSAQWYVRFVRVNDNGREEDDSRLSTLVGIMERKRLVFKIRCEGDGKGGTKGALYIWGLNIPPHGRSMVGVFKPDAVEENQGTNAIIFDAE